MYIVKDTEDALIRIVPSRFFSSPCEPKKLAYLLNYLFLINFLVDIADLIEYLDLNCNLIVNFSSFMKIFLLLSMAFIVCIGIPVSNCYIRDDVCNFMYKCNWKEIWKLKLLIMIYKENENNV